MELREYFSIGLTVDAYTQLLDADQTDLHKLSERRAKIDETVVETIRAAGTHHILVITEPWCGDSLAIFPTVAKLFMAAGCEIRVIRRDEQPELIDDFLTNGGRSIPIVIVLDEAFNERFHWGPRPAPAQQIVMESKAAIAKAAINKLRRFTLSATTPARIGENSMAMPRQAPTRVNIKGEWVSSFTSQRTVMISIISPKCSSMEPSQTRRKSRYRSEISIVRQ